MDSCQNDGLLQPTVIQWASDFTEQARPRIDYNNKVVTVETESLTVIFIVQIKIYD